LILKLPVEIRLVESTIPAENLEPITTRQVRSLPVETEYLPTTSYVILGLLTFREMSGYDLKQLINKSITHFYWSPAKSQIYG